MSFVRTCGNGILIQLAKGTLNSPEDAANFYNLPVSPPQNDSERLRLMEVGPDYGFDEGGIIYEFASRDVLLNKQGEQLNCLNSIGCHDLLMTYDHERFGRTDKIILLSKVEVSDKLAIVSVTLNAWCAHYILIVGHYTSAPKPKLPWKLRRGASFHTIADIRNIKTHPHALYSSTQFVEYTILPFSFPYMGTKLVNVIECYRAHLFEEYLRDNFLLQSEVESKYTQMQSYNFDTGM